MRRRDKYNTNSGHERCSLEILAIALVDSGFALRAPRNDVPYKSTTT
jgi:hypothetical protein